MTGKRIITLTAIVLALLTLTAASAADNATDDAVSIDDDNQEILTTDEENEDNLEVIHRFNSFTYLNETINANSDPTVNLTRDFLYFIGDENDLNGGIPIDRDVTINGNGHTISGSTSARIFNVQSSHVTFRDIIFANSRQGQWSYGGAILTSGGSCTVINCTFINNEAYYGSGMYGGTAINCTFRNNYAEYGGCIMNGNAYNCLFKDNRASEKGGAIHTGEAENCTFIHNSAKNGGAMYVGSASNCTFFENEANYWGGAVTGEMNSLFTANNCTFILNYATTKDSYDAYYANCNSCEFATDMIHVANYTSMYGSGEGIYMNISYRQKQYDATAVIDIYKDNNLLYHTSILSGYVFNVTLMPGIYTAVLSVPDTGVAPLNITLNITKLPTSIASASLRTLYYDGKYITATLRDGDGNVMKGENITVIINGIKKILKTVSTGKIRLTTNNLAPKTSYTAIIRYAGDEINAGSSKSIKVNVVKPATKILAKGKAFKLKSTKKITAILKDSRNRALKNKWVTFRANGVNYKVKTNAKGIATATVKIAKKGTFKTLIKFAGDKYYKAVSKTVNVSVR